MGSPPRTPRRPLHERSNSQTNTLAAVRLVPYTPPRLRGETRDAIYSRTPVPTLPSHFLPPATRGGSGGAGSLQPQGSALDQSHSSVSGDPYPAKQLAAPLASINNASTTHQPPQSGHSSSPSTSSSLRPLPKKRKQVKVNPDKTFSVLEVVQQDEVLKLDEDCRSPASQISHDHPFSDGLDLTEPSKYPPSCLPEQSTAATTLDTLSQINQLPISQGPIINSPWNYKLVGGLRKVPKTPDLKKQSAKESDQSLPALPPTSDNSSPADDFLEKDSLHSTTSKSAASDNTNYEVYPSSPPPSSSESNYQILGQSSPASPGNYPTLRPWSSSDSIYQVLAQRPPASQIDAYPPLPPRSSGDSDHQILGQSSPTSQVVKYSSSPNNSNYQVFADSSSASSEIDIPSGNYKLHGDPSPSTSYVQLSSPVRPTYSQESLVVLPLQPRAQGSVERFGYYKSRSRESLRTGSLTSISTILGQEAAQAIASQAIRASGSHIHIPSLKRLSSLSSWADPLALNPARSPMQAHPHQWSSQLSTVPSVSDGGTDRGSRSWSDGNGRRSSGFPSSHSRQIPSISSSLQQEENEILERPQPSFARNGYRDGTGSTIRMVEDQDEYGDGITELSELRTRPSRRNMSGFFSSSSSDNGRTNTMRSTSSSRANSLVANSIPTWARLYYGSGERKYLVALGSSTESSDGRPHTSFRSGSPDSSNFPISIYSPRRRPRQADLGARRTSTPGTEGPMNISPLPQLGSDSGLVDGSLYGGRFRRRTSSIWSPHLKKDSRARMSIWDQPPSVNWSTESSPFGRRNVQVVMFICGFLIPFAWMLAAVLPLPPNPLFSMRERDYTSSHLDFSTEMASEFRPMDEIRYESAKWWRNLNRAMSVIGIVIIILLIVLLVVGFKRRWV